MTPTVARCGTGGSSRTGLRRFRVTRTFAKPGTYTAKVTATDDEGDKCTQELTVTVTAPGVLPPTVERDERSDERTGALDVQFGATGADPDGPASELLYHGTSATAGKQFQQNPTHTYAQKGTYTATSR